MTAMLDGRSSEHFLHEERFYFPEERKRGFHTKPSVVSAWTRAISPRNREVGPQRDGWMDEKGKGKVLGISHI